MKNITLLPVAILMGCGALLSGCEKQSNEVAPTPAAVSSLAVLKPGELNPVPVNGTYMQGSDATGLGCSVEMTLMSHHVTPVGEIDVWETIKGQRAECAPEARLVFSETYTYVIDGDPYTYQINCKTEPDGHVKMHTVWNMKRKSR